MSASTATIVTTILLPLLLSGEPETNSEDVFACGPAPVQSVIVKQTEPSACNATGLAAANLNHFAFSGFNRRSEGSLRLACESVRNYRGCGFPVEIQGPNDPMLCDELQMSINEIGVVANYNNIDDLCAQFND